MSGKNKVKKPAVIEISLTESEKNAIEKFVETWDIDMATIVRRLVQALLRGKVTLPELLQKYRETLTSREIRNKTPELRIHKVKARLSPREEQELTILANVAFYRPSELVRILLRLLIMSIIDPDDIWR
ncbi:MAG: hypothetical protein LBJ22_06285 [Synergistaceae bacterium]|nr:hypothetical protein [Synergistaceae bacterium]